MAITEPIVAGGLMVLSAIGMYVIFGFNFFTAIPLVLSAAGGTLAVAAAYKANRVSASVLIGTIGFVALAVVVLCALAMWPEYRKVATAPAVRAAAPSAPAATQAAGCPPAPGDPYVNYHGNEYQVYQRVCVNSPNAWVELPKLPASWVGVYIHAFADDHVYLFDCANNTIDLNVNIPNHGAAMNCGRLRVAGKGTVYMYVKD